MTTALISTPARVPGTVEGLIRRPVVFSSETVEWATPQDFFDRCAAEFGSFDLDVWLDELDPERGRHEGPICDDCGIMCELMALPASGGDGMANAPLERSERSGDTLRGVVGK